MKKSDFYFDLPERLIAQHPLEQRDSSRMLVMDRKTGALSHRHFHDLIEYVKPGDCLVMNNSRVIPARLMGRAEGRTTPIEVVLLTDHGDGIWECLTRPGKKTREGVKLSFGDGLLTGVVESVNPKDGNRMIRFQYEGVFLELLDKLGTMPLPPYIKEKLDDPEVFHPDRMASRILGMGDVLTLIEKAQDEVDEKKAAEVAQKLKENSFDMEDLLEQIKQVRNMGPLGKILEMFPGMSGKVTDEAAQAGEQEIKYLEAIINSMTKAERANPDLINPSRKRRIAAGSGTDVPRVNRVLKQYKQMKEMMKMLGGKGKNGKRRKRMPFNPAMLKNLPPM